jgi:hypothetical protein
LSTGQTIKRVWLEGGKSSAQARQAAWVPQR